MRQRKKVFLVLFFRDDYNNTSLQNQSLPLKEECKSYISCPNQPRNLKIENSVVRLTYKIQNLITVQANLLWISLYLSKCFKELYSFIQYFTVFSMLFEDCPWGKQFLFYINYLNSTLFGWFKSILRKIQTLMITKTIFKQLSSESMLLYIAMYI